MKHHPTQSAVRCCLSLSRIGSDVFTVDKPFFKGKNIQEWSEDAAGANLSDHDDEAAPRDVKLETRYSPKTVSTINLLDERVIPYDLIIRLLESVCFEHAYTKYSAAILVFLP